MFVRFSSAVEQPQSHETKNSSRLPKILASFRKSHPKGGVWGWTQYILDGKITSCPEHSLHASWYVTDSTLSKYNPWCMCFYDWHQYFSPKISPAKFLLVSGMLSTRSNYFKNGSQKQEVIGNEESNFLFISHLRFPTIVVRSSLFSQLRWTATGNHICCCVVGLRNSQTRP